MDPTLLATPKRARELRRYLSDTGSFPQNGDPRTLALARTLMSLRPSTDLIPGTVSKNAGNALGERAGPGQRNPVVEALMERQGLLPRSEPGEGFAGARPPQSLGIVPPALQILGRSQEPSLSISPQSQASPAFGGPALIAGDPGHPLRLPGSGLETSPPPVQLASSGEPQGFRQTVPPLPGRKPDPDAPAQSRVGTRSSLAPGGRQKPDRFPPVPPRRPQADPPPLPRKPQASRAVQDQSSSPDPFPADRFDMLLRTQEEIVEILKIAPRLVEEAGPLGQRALNAVASSFAHDPADEVKMFDLLTDLEHAGHEKLARGLWHRWLDMDERSHLYSELQPGDMFRKQAEEAEGLVVGAGVGASGVSAAAGLHREKAKELAKKYGKYIGPVGGLASLGIAASGLSALQARRELARREQFRRERDKKRNQNQ